jgi:leader peptidase (prepilin peptidase) / N-methyltransferase
LNDFSLVPVVAVAALLGAIVGSFLTVVIRRVPARASILRPGSACPICNHAIRTRDSIPIASWLILRGRCRDCGHPISRLYPVVEVTTATIFAGVTLWLMAPSSPVASIAHSAGGRGVIAVALVTGAFLWFAASSVALTAIDLAAHRLPNAVVVPGYVVVIVGLVMAAAIAGDWTRAGITVAGTAILLVTYGLMAATWRGAMGGGDVKLAGVIGGFLGFVGWAALAIGAIAAFLLGGIASIALLLTRRATRTSGIPFGPWMLAGAWIGIIAGQPLMKSYLSLFGITDA